MQTCVGAKLVLRFQALIAHAFLNRSILFLYHKSSSTSGSICRKRTSFISGFGAIVSHIVRGDIFFTHPVFEGGGACVFEGDGRMMSYGINKRCS